VHVPVPVHDLRWLSFEATVAVPVHVLVLVLVHDLRWLSFEESVAVSFEETEAASPSKSSQRSPCTWTCT